MYQPADSECEEEDAAVAEEEEFTFKHMTDFFSKEKGLPHLRCFSNTARNFYSFVAIEEGKKAVVSSSSPAFRKRHFIWISVYTDPMQTEFQLEHMQ